MADLVPFELHGPGGVVSVSELASDAALQAKLDNLPEVNDVKRYMALAIVESLKPLMTGQLPFKSAGEASKVMRDLAAVAKDLGFLEVEAAEVKKAESAEERADLFEQFRKKAEEAKNGGS